MPSETSQYATVTDCRLAHEEEMIASFDLSGPRKFPGDERVRSSAEPRCDRAFASYVGLPFDDSGLEIYVYWPAAESWNDGDRLAMCSIYDPSRRTTTETFRGAKV
jgi:putative regulator of septum formation